MRVWGFVVAFGVVAAMATSISSAQDGSTIRKWMYDGNHGWIEAFTHYNLTATTLAQKLGLDGMEQLPELGFMWATCVRASVSLEGSAEEIGLSTSELTDYLSLRLRNDLSFLPKCTNDVTSKANAGQTVVDLRVWTVGKDYPVAYYIHLDTNVYTVAGGHSVPRDSSNPFQTEYLGYGNSNSVPGSVDKIIEDSVRSLGEAYLKGTGK